MFIQREMAFCLFYWALSRVNTLTPAMDALSEISICCFGLRSALLTTHINMQCRHQHFDLFKHCLESSFNLLLKDARPACPYGRGCTWVSDPPRTIFCLPACVRVHAAVKWGISAACHLSLGIALVRVDSVSTLGLSVSIQTWPVLFSTWQWMLMDISSSPSQCPSLGAGCIPDAS